MRITTTCIGLVGFVTACTGSIGGGGGDDGSSPPPPPPTNVQILVQDGFVPQAGVRVLFQNADGSLLSAATTDATGIAMAPMPDGGNLTVIRTYPIVQPPQQQQLDAVYTYVGVKAGDQLQLGAELSTGVTGAINVKVPVTAQGTVSVVTACGSGQGTAPNVPITVAGCPAMVDFFVTDDDQSAFVMRAAYADNVDLSAGALSGTLASTLSAINVPTNTSVNVEENIVVDNYAVYTTGQKRVDGGPANVNLPNLQGVDELVVATIAGTSGTEMVANHSAYAVTPTIIDATAGIIPSVTAAPTYSPTSITWTEAGPGTADFVIAVLDVTRNGDMGTGGEYTRAIIAPHVGASLALPLLTGADAIYNPTMTDQIAGTQGLASATGGYDAARARAFAVTSVVEAAPLGGSVTLSYAGNTPPSL